MLLIGERSGHPRNAIREAGDVFSCLRCAEFHPHATLWPAHSLGNLMAAVVGQAARLAGDTRASE